MNFLAIIGLVAKGIGYAKTAIEVGRNAAPILEAVGGLVASAQAGTVTAEDLAATEQSLDAMISDFNEPM